MKSKVRVVLFMRFVYLIQLVFVVGAVSLSDPAHANANNAVCLAAIAHVNRWSDEPGPNQSPYGVYLGRFGIAYGFQSHDAAYQSYCRITGTKIEISDTNRPWEVKPGVSYHYRREGLELIVTTKQRGEADSRTSFIMRELLGRMKEMEAAAQ